MFSFLHLARAFASENRDCDDDHDHWANITNVTWALLYELFVCRHSLFKGFGVVQQTHLEIICLLALFAFASLFNVSLYVKVAKETDQDGQIDGM